MTSCGRVILLQAAEQNATGPGQKPGQQVAQQEPQLQEAAHWAPPQDTQPQPPKGNQSGPRQGTEPLGARQAELQQQQALQPGPQLEQRQGEDSCRSSNETTGTVPAQGESAGSLCLSAETGRETSGHPPAEAGSGVQLTESSAAASEGPAPVIPAGNTQACQEQALGEEEDLLKVCGIACICMCRQRITAAATRKLANCWSGTPVYRYCPVPDMTLPLEGSLEASRKRGVSNHQLSPQAMAS